LGVQGLRTPKRTNASYTMSLRRTDPIRMPVVGALVNNLTLNGAYQTAESQSEFQRGTANNMTVGADYQLAAASRTKGVPGFIDRAIINLPNWLGDTEALRALRAARFRWTPTQIRLTSAMARSTDKRLSFTKPAEAFGDTGTVARGLSHVWRNTGQIEFRPLGGLAASLNVNSLRDLRRYGTDAGVIYQGTNTGAVASLERDRLLGVDVGLERERTMNAGINMQPAIAVWLRPRVDLGTSFTMVRDPNSRSLLRTRDSAGTFRLPRRLGNSQTMTAGTAVDLSRAILAYTGDSSWMRRLTRTFQPIDVSWTRSLNSNFDGAPFTPGLGYQLGVGGLDDFQRVNGRLASSASVRTDRSVNGGLSLPYGLALASRFQQTIDRSFQRLPDNTHQPTEGRSTNLPNLSLRWTFMPPRLLQPVVASIGTQVGYNNTRSVSTQAAVGASPEQRRDDRSHSMPVTASVTWAFAGNLSTSAGFRRSTTEGRQPGTLTGGSSEEYSLDMARPFTLPKEWDLSDQVNARIGYSRSRTESFVGGTSATSSRSMLANYGRRSLNFNADTQMSENLTASLVFSRIVNQDYKNNQRTSQMVFSAVLQLQFFAGELR
jgi:hypothetical protein